MTDKLSPKRTYQVRLAGVGNCLPLVPSAPTQADAEALRKGIAKRMGWALDDLIVVGSSAPVVVAEAVDDAAEDATW